MASKGAESLMGTVQKNHLRDKHTSCCFSMFLAFFAKSNIDKVYTVMCIKFVTFCLFFPLTLSFLLWTPLPKRADGSPEMILPVYSTQCWMLTPHAMVHVAKVLDS